ncbi:MAG: phosphoribosylformylglycinamidine synthase [Pseudomonadota bacterium]
MLIIPGGTALSDFRARSLLAQLQAVDPAIASLSARHVYLLTLDGALSADARSRCDALLDADAGPLPTRSVRWVVPRLGTQSPWSSKATDIFHNCGLGAVHRVERGTVYVLDGWHGLNPVAVDAVLHDRMTESVLTGEAEAAGLFVTEPPRALARVPVLTQGRQAITAADAALGLALSDDEVDYLVDNFRQLARDPSDAELMMFAQANSEHCRHKIFRADWVIDGETQADGLFNMIRNTHARHTGRVLSAYSDNAAVLEGYAAQRFFADSADGVYRPHAEPAHIQIKVETHNHPTAIAPFAGAATGNGGEIRDEGATGLGAKPKAGLCGFAVSNLRIPGAVRPWERDFGKPDRIASAFEIMRDGPLGAAAFNNEFGRPNLTGYFRTFEDEVRVGGRKALRGYHKPIMIAGGLGNVRPQHALKPGFTAGAKLVVLGGPAMLIGLGGGAASSVASGDSEGDLDFASVQRGNPEMERRCQEVIDRCTALGDDNPIASIHDVGAGGLSNAFPELVDDCGLGARFELRDIPNAEPGLSPLEIWCNEAQERYVLAIADADIARFEALCARERCPMAVVGEATAAPHLALTDQGTGDIPVDMPMAVLLGKAPKMTRDVTRLDTTGAALDTASMELGESARRVLQLPSVAAKTFLITIGDRSITGLIARDQLVGPWQMPVADCAITLNDYTGTAGEAMAMGERPPVALLNPAASARLAIGEALTNLAVAPVGDLSNVSLSANWMAACGHPGEDAALFDAVKAVGLELCPALGVNIPVGKDSLSMRTSWEDADGRHTQTAPVSLVATAFAPVHDARAAATPQIHPIEGNRLLLVDLGNGKNRLGSSALAQVWNQLGDQPADLDRPHQFVAAFNVLQSLLDAGLLRAAHDRSDGGLFATVCEMAFAGGCGVGITLDALGTDAHAALFSEELGWVVQVDGEHLHTVLDAFERVGIGKLVHDIGSANTTRQVRFSHAGAVVLDVSREAALADWWSTSHAMARLRDNPTCADSELETVIDPADPGQTPRVPASLADWFAPSVAVTRPRVAVLREQGVNGQIEMAAAFDRAGFEAVDVHMSDLIAGRVSLDTAQVLAVCGGFSYGDVLGAGGGWARSILFNDALREAFAAFFGRPDTVTLGVCNGCQMLSHLKALIPGAAHWPEFVRNASEQFEARASMVEVQGSNSLLLEGMAGWQLPVAVAHGEGQARWPAGEAGEAVLHYVDNRGGATERYPANPNGSPGGANGFTSADGRATIMMPHPERVFRSIQLSHAPADWPEASPWLRLFQNARRAV